MSVPHHDLSDLSFKLLQKSDLSVHLDIKSSVLMILKDKRCLLCLRGFFSSFFFQTCLYLHPTLHFSRSPAFSSSPPPPTTSFTFSTFSLTAAAFTAFSFWIKSAVVGCDFHIIWCLHALMQLNGQNNVMFTAALVIVTHFFLFFKVELMCFSLISASLVWLLILIRSSLIISACSTMR